MPTIPWETRTDPELVAAVVDRHAEALEELFRRHSASIFGVARRVTRVDQIAEEVLQEVFLRLWNTPTRFDASRGTLRSYLLIDTHARSVEAVRSESSRRNREEKDGRRPGTPEPSVERLVWDRELTEHLRTALETLPGSERDAIELAYYGGYTYRQVATILSEPEGTVKSRIRSGLLRLHDRLCAVDVRGGTWELT